MKTTTALLALLLAAPALAEAPAAAPAPAAGTMPGPAAPRAGKPAHRLAVMDFALAGSAHPDLARVLSDAAAAGAAAAAPDWQVLSQGEVAALLGLDRARQMLGCTDDQACMADLAGALDSERLLSGSLTILERSALLSVRLLDVKKSRTIARANATLLDASERELQDAARRLAHEALTGKRLDTSGVVRITVDRPGATVTLDGKALGETPLKEAVRVGEGPHAITVQKPGYVRWSTTVSVAAGQTVPVEVDLIPIQLLGEASRSRLWSWGWVATGVTCAAAASGIYFGTQAKQTHDDYLAATNRSQANDLADQAKTQSLVANVSWGIAGASAVAAGYLLTSAMVEDARAATPPEPLQKGPAVAAAPVRGGALLTVGGRF